MNQEKTPVSILQELMQQQNVIPHYQLLSEHGSRTHKPTFVVRVSADGMTGIGKGNSKKIAKQEAARNFLHKIGIEKVIDYDQNNHSKPRELTTPAPTIEPNFETSSMDVNMQKKAVAVLKYYTMQLNLPSPLYEEISECGPPHLPVFTYRCSIGTYNKQASGRTKIEARDTSALMMFEALKKINFEIRENDHKATSSIDTELASTKIEKVHNDAESSDSKNVTNSNSISVSQNQSTSTSSMNYGSINNKSIDHFCIIKNYMLAKNITYEELWKDNIEYDFKTLDKVLAMLGIKYNLTFMKQDMTFIACLLIDIVPAFYIIEIGATVNEVTKSVAKNMLFVLKVVTK